MTVTVRVDVTEAAIAALRQERWPNGRGVTRTVAEGGDADGRWRVSIATVTDGAPFSVLPGVDRVLLPLTDGSVGLQGPSGTLPADTDGSVRFDGRLPVTATVPGGAAHVCNVITTTGTHRVSTTRHDDLVVVRLERQETP